MKKDGISRSRLERFKDFDAGIEDGKLSEDAGLQLSENYYLLKNPKRTKNDVPFIAFIWKNIFFVGGS